MDLVRSLQPWDILLIYCNNQFKKVYSSFAKLLSGALYPPSDVCVRSSLCPFSYFNKILIHISSWVIKPGPWSRSWIFFRDHKSITIYCKLSLLHFGCKENNQFDFGIDHLVMSMCQVFSCVVGRGCLLRPVCSLGKTLLAFALLHFAFQGQNCLLLQVSLDFLPLHFSPCDVKDIFFFGVCHLFLGEVN